MELIERGETYERYQIGNRAYRFVTAERWARQFDTGLLAPWTMLWEDRVTQGNWHWFGKGTQGYAVNLNTSTVRVFPVRGDTNKYIQVSGMAPQVSTYNQIDDKNLEIYIDQTYTRWALKMGRDGFKPEILVRPGYSGDGTFQFKFELHGGLYLQGAWIMDGLTRVLKMQNPFVTGANGNRYPAQESLVDGVATITVDFTDIPLPAVVDPTVGPINPSKDTYLRSDAPTTGQGQQVFFIVGDTAGVPFRALLQFDASAAPPGITVTGATLGIRLTNNFGIAGETLDLYRGTLYDWEDGDGANAEANWNNYKDPNVAWPGGAGGFGDTDATNKVSATVAAQGSFTNFSPVGITQDAIDNRSGLVNVMIKSPNESALKYGLFDSLEAAIAARRPTFTFDYTEPAGALMSGGLLSDSVLSGGGFNNFGGFGL